MQRILKRQKTSHCDSAYPTFASSLAQAGAMPQEGDATNSASASSDGKPGITKADVLGMIRKKDEIDAELKALQELLHSQGEVGMEGPLLDVEGYPRSDIDVYSVRHARHKIICLTNDHKALMKQIEDGLYAVHAQARTEYMDSDDAAIPDAKPAKPFAKIQFVTPESPAALAGLQPGDMVFAFGSATTSNFKSLQDLATIVANSENRSLTVEVSRQGVSRRLTLTPKKWSGRGLLGCSFLEERQL